MKKKNNLDSTSRKKDTPLEELAEGENNKNLCENF